MKLRTLCALALVLPLLACDKKSPTTPTVQGPDPKPAAGTQTHEISLPGADKPLIFWVSGVNPPVGGTLARGAGASVAYTCGGPGGYSIFVGSRYLSDTEQGDECGGRSGGNSMRTGRKCDADVATNFPVPEGSTRVHAMRFYVWKAEQGRDFNYNGRCADDWFDVPLNWTVQ